MTAKQLEPDGSASAWKQRKRRLKHAGVALAAVIIPPIYRAYMTLVERTSRVDHGEIGGVIDRRQPGEKIAFALLHQDVLAFPWFFRGRGVTALAQRSDAGDLISAALESIGFRMARGGSSSRDSRRSNVIHSMIRSADDGEESGAVVAVTPDGSRGPAGIVRGGVALFALRTGADLYCTKIQCSRAWFCPTWDRTQIPLPFSRIKVYMSPPMRIDPKATREEFEAFRERIESTMHDMHRNAFTEFGREPVPKLHRLNDL
jgi:lysophospholipid acyltransferase (LPLAT)-like uncharacterized protein